MATVVAVVVAVVYVGECGLYGGSVLTFFCSPTRALLLGVLAHERLMDASSGFVDSAPTQNVAKTIGFEHLSKQKLLWLQFKGPSFSFYLQNT